jgi:hypothetical protein
MTSPGGRSVMRSFFLLLSLIFMTDKADSGLGMDPNGGPTADLGLEMDPNG